MNEPKKHFYIETCESPQRIKDSFFNPWSGSVVVMTKIKSSETSVSGVMCYCEKPGLKKGIWLDANWLMKVK